MTTQAPVLTSMRQRPRSGRREASCPRSGPVEGVWGNREVSPASAECTRAAGERCVSSQPRPDRELAGARLDLLEQEPALAARDDRPLGSRGDDRAGRRRVVELDRPRAPDDDLLAAEERERPGVGPRLRPYPVVQVWRARLPVDDPVR